MTKVVGVRFKDTGKTYFFDPEDLDVHKGDTVIVETEDAILACKKDRNCKGS